MGVVLHKLFRVIAQVLRRNYIGFMYYSIHQLE